MSLYEETLFPFCTEVLTKSLVNNRKRILQSAQGDILEIGIGSGLSIGAYPPSVNSFIGIDPNAGMLKKAEKAILKANKNKFEVLNACAEGLPFEDNSFDGVASFLTLCTVQDLEKSLNEIRRVLRPNGKLYFIEHEAQPEKSITRNIQNSLQPLWKKIACGCHINREISIEIERSGFCLTEIKILGFSGFPNFWSPLKRGVAILKYTEE